MENYKHNELRIESQRLIKVANVILANRLAGDNIKSLASLSKIVFEHPNYFTTMRRQNTAPSPKMVDYLVDNYNINRDYIFKGIGGIFKTNEQCETAHLDNPITNPTNTQEMDPLTMDYINTLKEQLAKVTAVVENQTAIIERLTQKGDGEVLSRRVGAVEKKQDELTENL